MTGTPPDLTAALPAVPDPPDDLIRRCRDASSRSDVAPWVAELLVDASSRILADARRAERVSQLSAEIDAAARRVADLATPGFCEVDPDYRTYLNVGGRNVAAFWHGDDPLLAESPEEARSEAPSPREARANARLTCLLWNAYQTGRRLPGAAPRGSVAATPVPLVECPVGLFVAESGELGLRTEYGGHGGRVDAYLVATGEFFWGGSPGRPAEQRCAPVRPVVLDLSESTAPTLPRGFLLSAALVERIDALRGPSDAATRGVWSIREEGEDYVAVDAAGGPGHGERDTRWSALARFAVSTDGRPSASGRANADFSVASVNLVRDLLRARLSGSSDEPRDPTPRALADFCAEAVATIEGTAQNTYSPRGAEGLRRAAAEVLRLALERPGVRSALEAEFPWVLLVEAEDRPGSIDAAARRSHPE